MNKLSSLRFNRDLWQDKTWAIAYLILFIVLVPGFGLLSLLDATTFTPMVAAFLQWVAFLLLGIGHIFILRMRIELLPEETSLFSETGWIFTLFLSLLLAVILSLLYFFMAVGGLALSFLSLCAFLLPFTMAHTWTVFSQIPERQYKIWFIPEDSDKVHMPLMKGMPVRLRLRRRYFDIREEIFTVTVPVRIKMGKLFYYFLLEQKKNGGPGIECEDEDKRSYGWEFYSKQFGGMTKNFLDPEKTLAENKLGKNSIIVARRARIGRTLLN